MGHGAYGARDQIVAFAEKIGAPVVTTFKAEGLVPDSHLLGAGVLGRYGSPIASCFMNEADVLVAFGASFSNQTGIAMKDNIIQVDYDRLQLDKLHAVKVPVRGDIRAFCEAATNHIHANPDAEDQKGELADRWHMWRDEKHRRLAEEHCQGIHSFAVFDALGELVPDDTIFAVDVGNNTYSFGRYLETKGTQRVLISGYLGSIGFSFTASMGAWEATQASRTSSAIQNRMSPR